MKPILYSTTALAAAGLLAFGAGDASAQMMKKAQPLKLSLGGFYLDMVGYADQQGAWETANGINYANFNMVQDSEVYFRGNTTLDNGIRIDAVIQLETDQARSNNGTVIDESYLKFTGAFGDLRLGSTKHALFVLKHRAPVVGAYSHDAGEPRNWVIRPARIAEAVSATNGVGPGDNDKVVYFTPRFSGFGAGVSYSPNLTAEDVQADHSGGDRSQTSAVLTFENKFGDVSVKADVGWWHDHGGNASQDNDGWRGGAILGFAGFEFGGSYAKQDGPETTGVTTSQDGDAWDIGLSYKTGPWGVSATYISTSSEGTIANTNDDTRDQLQFGGSYSIGPGISLLGTVQITDYSDETTGAANNNEGWAATAGVKVNF